MNTIKLKDIKFINWNANGIENKKSTIIEFLSRHKINITCITEKHLINNEPFKIAGYNIYRKDRNTTHSSEVVAILIKKSIKHHQSSTTEIINIEATTITVPIDKHDTKIISAYNLPNKQIRKDDISGLTTQQYY